MGFTDYSHVNMDTSSSEYLQPTSEGSWRNRLIERTDVFFTIAFAVECGLKIVAMGFVWGKGSYLRDPWNKLDFTVVVSSMLSDVPGMPDASGLRTLRVLRPLRSVNKIPELRTLVVAMLKSIPKLVSVIMLLSFIFAVFGILGIQLFSGRLHSRCRLTPFPVTLAWQPGLNYTEHKCLDVDEPASFNFMSINDRPSWTKSSSMWNEPRDCWWPLDEEDTRFCSYERGYGSYECYHGQDLDDDEPADESAWRWCGSNFDALGNLRFKSNTFFSPAGLELSKDDLRVWDTHIEDLNWGLTNFDNIGYAAVTIFQSITLEGWSDVMYFCQDGISVPLATIFFVVLTLFGGFFALNLVLAVLEEATTAEAEVQKQKLEQQREDEKKAAEARRERDRQWDVQQRLACAGGGKTSLNLIVQIEVDETSKAQAEKEAEAEAKKKVEAKVTDARADGAPQPKGPKSFADVIEGPAANYFFTALIIANTVVLALDRYPISSHEQVPRSLVASLGSSRAFESKRARAPISLLLPPPFLSTLCRTSTCWPISYSPSSSFSR